MNGSHDASLSMGRGEAALVWFPAVGDTVKSFGRAALLLTRRMPGRLRVVGFDPPGYAPDRDEAIPPFAALYDWAALAADAVGRDARRVIVAGNSSGASLALAAAVRSSAPVVGCVFVCWPDWRLGRAPTSSDLCPQTAAELDHLLALSWHEPPALSSEQRERMIARFGSARYRRHVDSFNAGAHGRMLDRARVPIAYVAGRSDGLVPPELVARTAEKHRSAWCVIDAAAHYPQSEQPIELALRIASSAERWFCHQDTS
jgi:pimeloyl-ACP methyl ester carboxylesterase